MRSSHPRLSGPVLLAILGYCLLFQPPAGPKVSAQDEACYWKQVDVKPYTTVSLAAEQGQINFQTEPQGYVPNNLTNMVPAGSPSAIEGSGPAGPTAPGEFPGVLSSVEDPQSGSSLPGFLQTPPLALWIAILLLGLVCFAVFSVLIIVSLVRARRARQFAGTPAETGSTGILTWILLSGVLMVSCLVSLCGITGLYLTMARPAAEVGLPTLEQTMTALAGTEAAFAQQMTVNAPGQVELPSLTPEPAEEVTPVPEAQPTPTPNPTNPPEPTVLPEATQVELTGSQHLDANSLVDDFSSQALGWPVYDDGVTILKYENGGYSMQVKEPGLYDWVYFPVDFPPSEILFDVQGPEGNQDGTFGVFCHHQDENNYYYVEFDLQQSSYTIAQNLNGELIPLTVQNEQGQYWHPASSLKPPPAANRINVGCYLGSIYLMVNDEIIDEVSIGTPFAEKGRSAFFVYTFDFAGEEGYKVHFDNVETYNPVQ